MKTVVLIEDNLENAEMTIRILKSAGYAIAHCVRGLEGALLVRRQHPDIVLIDFDLPDIDGCTLALLLKKQLGASAPPMVAVTARAGVAEMRQAEKFGCSGFVSKPFMPDDLLNVIGQILQVSADT
jgi:CheY-like chemotaxis protein